MTPFFICAPGAYYAYASSDGMGKSIVLLLVVGSIFTWALMIDKGMALHKAKQLSHRFLGYFRDNKRGVSALAVASADDPAPVAQIYNGAVAKLQEFESSGAPMTEERINAIEAVLEQKISTQVIELERGMNFLATIVSVSPFFGLFGTVWGVMIAFCGVAQAGKPDIAAMAPGIAGALLTTVVGLLVAIPSLIGYNLLNGTIRNLTVAMDNFSEEFVVRLKLEAQSRKD